MGEKVGVGVVQTPPARGGLAAVGGSLARRRRCGGSSSASRLARVGTCARKQKSRREGGEGGQNGDRGGHSSGGERATTVCGARGAGSTSGGGPGAWVAMHLLAPPENNHPECGNPAKKQRREGEEWWIARGHHAPAGGMQG